MKIQQKMPQVTAKLNVAKEFTLGIIKIFIIGIFSYACNKMYEPEKIFVPSGYKGWIFIVNYSKGAVCKRKDGFRVYHIGENKIFFSQCKPNWGVIGSNTNDIQVFYIDSLGNILTKLPVWIDARYQFMEKNKNSIIALPLPLSGMGKYPIYPIIIDSLKNINKYDQGDIPITEQQIDSILNIRN